MTGGKAEPTAGELLRGVEGTPEGREPDALRGARLLAEDLAARYRPAPPPGRFAAFRMGIASRLVDSWKGFLVPPGLRSAVPWGLFAPALRAGRVGLPAWVGYEGIPGGRGPLVLPPVEEEATVGPLPGEQGTFEMAGGGGPAGGSAVPRRLPRALLPDATSDLPAGPLVPTLAGAGRGHPGPGPAGGTLTVPNAPPESYRRQPGAVALRPGVGLSLAERLWGRGMAHGQGAPRPGLPREKGRFPGWSGGAGGVAGELATPFSGAEGPEASGPVSGGRGQEGVVAAPPPHGVRAQSRGRSGGSGVPLADALARSFALVLLPPPATTGPSSAVAAASLLPALRRELGEELAGVAAAGMAGGRGKGDGSGGAPLRLGGSASGGVGELARVVSLDQAEAVPDAGAGEVPVEAAATALASSSSEGAGLARKPSAPGLRSRGAGSSGVGARAVPGYFLPRPLAAKVLGRTAPPRGGASLLGQRPAPSFTPRVAAGAEAAARLAPRGAIPAPGRGVAGEVAAFQPADFLAADSFEAAFPSRYPMVAPPSSGGGREEPDFGNASPLEPPPPPPPVHRLLHGVEVGASPLDVGPLLRFFKGQADGPSGPSFGQAFPGGGPSSGRAAGGGAGPWGLPSWPGGRGGPAISMALVRPIMKVVEEVARPALKEERVASPGAPGMARDGEARKAFTDDPKKLDWAAREVLAEIRRIFEVERERRGL